VNPQLLQASFDVRHDPDITSSAATTSLGEWFMMRDMQAKPNVAKDIDEYIAGAPERVRPILERVRRTIARAAPGAREAIRYAIPTFVSTKNLVHFAAYAQHIGVYPVPRAARADAQISAYATGKGTLRFPLDQPLPYPLITRVVKLRSKELAEGGKPLEVTSAAPRAKKKAPRKTKATKKKAKARVKTSKRAARQR
jgi:uncharacterized protein YdhG (YjbR/CyaY superfamily)